MKQNPTNTPVIVMTTLTGKLRLNKQMVANLSNPNDSVLGRTNSTRPNCASQPGAGCTTQSGLDVTCQPCCASQVCTGSGGGFV